MHIYSKWAEIFMNTPHFVVFFTTFLHPLFIKFRIRQPQGIEKRIIYIKLIAISIFNSNRCFENLITLFSQ